MAIDAAIAAAQPVEERKVVQVQLHTGRIVLLNVPADLSIEEMLALSGYIGSKLPATMAGARPRSRILVPT